VVKDGRVRVVYRHYAFLGDSSRWAAEATECAAEQGRFWQMHDALYDSQRRSWSKDALKAVGREIGLGAPFEQCVDSGRYAAGIKAEAEAAAAKGVYSTPTVFVNGTKVEGVPTYADLRAIVERLAPR
jgi:protein-disulfide isomerase